jgi:uncharacterized protein YndB with AHSA1/START domain
MIQDSIQRQITIRAPKERVYSAITDPKQIVSWFPDAIDGTREVGSTPTIDFGKEYVFQILVVAANPHDYFAYRWVPANADGTVGFKGDVLEFPNTLVEFRLADDPKGTALTLTESGFSTLPKEVAENQLKENSGGWDYMLDRLEKLFGQE